MKFLKNKAKKALMAAVTMSLVMGVYGCASAADLYGAQMSKGDTTITPVTPTGSATIADGDATNTGANYTVEGGYWNTVFGGYSNSSGEDATNNKVTIKKGAEAYEVFGGRAHAGNANNNEVIIYGTVYNNVYGAQATRSENTPNPTEANNNKVTIEGTVSGDVYGGYANKLNTESVDKKITVRGNKVNVSGTVNGRVYGGYSSYGEASDNTVIIAGKATGTVVGGRGGTTGTAFGNTITLGTEKGGTANITGHVAISECKGGWGPSDVGDKLNVYGSGHTIGGYLHATKADLNFYIKAEDLHANDKTMVAVTDTANVTDSTINAGVINVGQVDVGDKITLLSAGTLNADATLKTGTLSDGIIDVDLQIAQEGNSITATAGKAYVPEEPPKEDPLKENNANANPNAKSPVETMAAAISLLNAGSDMLATSSIMNAEQAVQMEKENAEAEGGMTVFTTVSGSNKRINSGSHVDMKAWNANLGLAKEIANKSGKFLFAPVVEYGRGSYDSYLDNGVHGEGDSHFVGGGLLAKQTFNSNWYVDGSVRAGRMSADYKTADIGTGISYDNSATYYAAHLGAGKVVKMTEKSSMDYYGKLFYSHQNSSTANLSSGHTYEFDAVDSFRTLLGFRYSQKAGKTAAFYTGLAWQHEFDSECNATVRTGAWSAEAPAPSVKGDTGILEVGYKFTPGNSGNFDVDFGAAGYVGKQRGGSLKLNMQWKF